MDTVLCCDKLILPVSSHNDSLQNTWNLQNWKENQIDIPEPIFVIAKLCKKRYKGPAFE